MLQHYKLHYQPITATHIKGGKTPQDPGPCLLLLLAHDRVSIPLSPHALKMSHVAVFLWAINPHAFHVNSFSFLTFLLWLLKILLTLVIL